jgi:hypothetical protein
MKFDFFKEQLELSPSDALDEEIIEIRDVSREMFDLAIQFAICKSVELSKPNTRSRSVEITSMLDLVFVAIRLGLSGLGYGMAVRLKNVLIDKRNALQGSHIERAYRLNRGHPIREVIVQSLGRAYFTFQDSPTSGKTPIYSKGEGDNARRNAFSGERFLFQDQLDNLDEFKRELEGEVISTLKHRTDIRSRSGKTHKISYTDPLSGEIFTL